MTMSKRLSDENASFKIIYLHTYTQCTYTYLSIPRFLALFNGLGFIVVEVKKKKKKQKQKQGSHPHGAHVKQTQAWN